MTRLRANELLGYPPDARLLIINADDFGMYHAVTEGVLRTIADGVVTSTTLMVPCPWGGYALRQLREHPEIAFGVHLTVVTDFDDYRWGPLTPRDRVPSLVDATGSFHRDEPHQAYLAHLELGDLEAEFRAQIEAVLASGLTPTHLDWHCLRDGGRPDVFDMTLGLAREYGLALRVFDPVVAAPLQARGLPTNRFPRAAGDLETMTRCLRITAASIASSFAPAPSTPAWSSSGPRRSQQRHILSTRTR
jgi:predicted glycoside hydrolase/deacetylase ChbG (UPF0249 family)